MEHKMRRFKQLLSEQSSEEILNHATNGILSLVDTDGEPYGVPISYVFHPEGKCIYFHSAVKGHKIDCISAGSRGSFCVVGQDFILPEKFTTLFRSVIVSGPITIVADSDEIVKGLRLLSEKYSPGIDPDAEIGKSLGHVAVLRLDIEHMSGKESIELVAKRKNDRQ